jgi:polyvinyl alcohol dehydrogenase (cytochrome)
MRLKSRLISCALAVLVAASSLSVAQTSRLNTKAKSGGAKSASGANGQNSSDWPQYGRDLAGSHYNPHEKALTPATVARLKTKWVFETGADVSSEPTVVNGVVYFGSWDGKEYAVDAKTGTKIWEFDAGSSSRSGAAYAEGMIFFGDIAGRLYALDAKTGQLKWKVRIDSHKDTVATSSPVYHGGRIYIGVSSHEEGSMLRNPKYECCTFRGGVAAFNARTGELIWRWLAIPDEPKPQKPNKRGVMIVGPAGAAVWSTVSIDPAANRLYVSTGNQYTGPAHKGANAIAALELKTGKLVWSNQTTPNDIWTFGCQNDPDCSDEDVDFGAIPLHFKGPGGKKLVGAGQKSGYFWALDSATGKTVWSTRVGDGGKLGGVEFGNATDGERLYVAISNAANKNKQGSVSALDGTTGKIIWQIPAQDGGSHFGPLTVTGTANNRLVFAGSSKGHIYAYNALSGEILWQFDTGGAVGGGPTVVDGVLYVGSGYQFLRIGKANNKLYAFSLDGK